MKRDTLWLAISIVWLAVLLWIFLMFILGYR